jgi:isochorismate synthase
VSDVRIRELGPAFDLLAAYAPGGFYMERGGLGVAGTGAAERISVAAGADQVRRGAKAAKAALSSMRGDGVAPVAVGVFPFDGARDAVLVIPARAVRRDAEGETREIAVGDEIAGDVDGPVARTPHEAFGDVQLRPVPPPAGYAYAVASALDRIHAGELRKVVLARTMEVRAGREIDPRRLVLRLRAVDPDCFAFAVPSVEGGTLVGASPELLVSRRDAEVRANPLAGSAPRSGDPDEDRANAQALGSSAKDRQEHAIVVEHVFMVLHPLCSELRHDREPQLLATANVWHLSTRFSGRLKRPAPSSLELAAALHPTPAVCGTPTGVARKLIAELEPFDRGCYAGPVGWVDANGDGDWAIALRCAELVGERATLYAGAGIVADSDPDRELDETERKFRAFLDSLRWG